MKFGLDKQQDYTIFSYQEPRLTSKEAPDLKSELKLLYEQGINNIVLDISEVQFIDSSGLSAVLMVRKLWSNKGVAVISGATHPHVVNIFNITRISKTLNMFVSVDQAVDYINGQLLELENQQA
jgi:anti-anti-sigma factor